jgi:hypothetical protein
MAPRMMRLPNSMPLPVKRTSLGRAKTVSKLRVSQSPALLVAWAKKARPRGTLATTLGRARRGGAVDDDHVVLGQEQHAVEEGEEEDPHHGFLGPQSGPRPCP